MRVCVLVAGAYNGPEHRHPVQAQPGDVIEVAGGWYATELIERGLVTGDVAGDVAPRVGPSEDQAAAGPEATPAKVKRPGGRKG